MRYVALLSINMKCAICLSDACQLIATMRRTEHIIDANVNEIASTSIAVAPEYKLLRFGDDV